MNDTDADVLKLLTDRESPRSWMNRQLGAQLVAQRGIAKAERLLVLLLDDDVEWVRYHAFAALVELDVPSTRLLPVAKRLLRDPFFRVRQSAHDYLTELLPVSSPTRESRETDSGDGPSSNDVLESSQDG